MPATASQPTTTPADRDAFVTIAEASALTGELARTWQWRARAEAGKASREHRAPLAMQARVGGKPQWLVHRMLDRRLSRLPVKDTADDKTRESLLTKYPAPAVELAYQRADLVRRWERACQVAERGTSEIDVAETLVAAASELEGAHTSARTLRRWRAAYRRLGIDGLVDRRACGGRLGADSNDRMLSDSGNPAARDPRAVELFYSLWRTESQESVAFAHDVALHTARREGWAWPATCAATRKWLDKYDDRGLSCLLREGPQAYCRKFLRHNDIDYALIQPGEMYQTDHHQCDFWVEYNGEQLRPWLTVVQDLRSRCIVGWNLGPAPHQDAIIAAFGMAFRQWAIPEVLRIDNGKDFASELLTGVTKGERDRLRRLYGRDWRKIEERDAHLVECQDTRFKGIVPELGIQLVYAIAYAPWSKGCTERFFSTLENRCGKPYFATYCGRSSLKRPECLEDIRRGYTREQRRYLKSKYGKDWPRVAVLKYVDKSRVPTMEDARQGIGEYIDEYHHQPHSAEDLAGMTPLAMWRTAQRLRRAGEQELIFLLQSRGCYRVTGKGVTLKLAGGRVSYGDRSPELERFKGRDVLITVDPSDVSYCQAFTADRKAYIGRLASNRRISPRATAEELRQAMTEVAHDRKQIGAARRSAARRTYTAVDILNANRRERAAERAATGTDDVRAVASVVPVHTGFEGVSEVAQRPIERASRPAPDLREMAKAMGFGGPRTPPEQRAEPQMSSSELLRIVAGTPAPKLEPEENRYADMDLSTLVPPAPEPEPEPDELDTFFDEYFSRRDAENSRWFDEWNRRREGKA